MKNTTKVIALVALVLALAALGVALNTSFCARIVNDAQSSLNLTIANCR